MFQCPHCEGKEIGLWAKVRSSSDTPAKCNGCGQLSYVHSKYRFGFQSAYPFLISWLLIALSIYIYFLNNKILVLILLPIIYIGGIFAELTTLPMAPISQKQSSHSSRFGNWFMFGLIALGVVWLVAGNL